MIGADLCHLAGEWVLDDFAENSRGSINLWYAKDSSNHMNGAEANRYSWLDHTLGIMDYDCEDSKLQLPNVTIILIWKK